MITDPRDFLLQHSGLRPNDYKSAGLGNCLCEATNVPLFRKVGIPQCAACCVLRQNYDSIPPAATGNKPMPKRARVDGQTISVRMALGSYLFISPHRLRFWGNQTMQAYNPRFECSPATGKMTAVVRDLICDPPEPPWMFISFAAAVSGKDLSVTRDNTVMRFSGQTVINRQPVKRINRAHVMALYRAGLTKKQWDDYLGAYYRHDHEAMAPFHAEHPKLLTIRYIPPKESSEHVVLRWLLNGDEA